MSRSLNLAVSLLLAVLAPAIVIGSVFAARAESALPHQASFGVDSSRALNCSPPAGWVPVQAQPGDSLSRLASQAGISLETVETANCLGREVQPGDFVYLPATPSSSSPTPCGPASNWVLQQVPSGTTFQELAKALGVSEAELRAANCLGPFTTIQDGVRLYVPPTATPLPTATPRPTSTPTESATITAQPSGTESATIQSP
jgi:LysM repeat protein